MAALGARIDELLDPYEAAVSLLVTVAGVARRIAYGILAEIGADMSAVEARPVGRTTRRGHEVGTARERNDE